MHGLRIARIAGINVRVDWSWVLIFALLTSNLGTVFSRWHPNWAPFEAFAVAAAASVIFFCCVLLHELAHSVVAKGFGVQVRSITLFLFGGVSNIERQLPSPKAEFWMALAGPVTSIALGIGLLLLASSLLGPGVASAATAQQRWAALADLGPGTTLLTWLGPINVFIGLFNLIPGFPLDGGRILRSALWGITGSLRRATAWASVIGQVIGWAFIGLGIAMAFGVRVPLLGGGLIGGLWLAFIGWFLRGAALGESSRLALDDVLGGMTVKDLVRQDAPAVSPEEPVASLVREHLMVSDDRTLPVVTNHTLLGLVSATDVQKVPREQWPNTAVRTIMHGVETTPTATPDQALAGAFERLAQQDLELMPVVAHGRYVGMLRRRDVTRWLEVSWRPFGELTRRDGGLSGGTGGSHTR